MPMYDYKCVCGKAFSRFLPLTQYKDPQQCLCGLQAEKVISAPAVIGDYPAYACPVTGKMIEGRKAHMENLARTGCRVLEPGETENCQRKRVAREAALEASLDSTVEEAIINLPSEAREKLVGELDNGINLEVSRATVV